MFLPYETTLNLWFSASALYKWETCPLPEVEPVDNTAASATDDNGVDGPASGTPSGLPEMRLVFKGVKWTAYPVFGMRINPQYDAVSQTRRDVDENSLAENQREARKAPKPPTAPKTDWEHS
jgi:hypothetical protein